MVSGRTPYQEWQSTLKLSTQALRSNRHVIFGRKKGAFFKKFTFLPPAPKALPRETYLGSGSASHTFIHPKKAGLVKQIPTEALWKRRDGTGKIGLPEDARNRIKDQIIRELLYPETDLTTRTAFYCQADNDAFTATNSSRRFGKTDLHFCDMRIDRWSTPQEKRTALLKWLKAMATTLNALKILHQYGIAHLDIKPQNIRSAEDGTSHLIDFGLGLFPEERTNQHKIYRTNSLLGTPQYLPLLNRRQLMSAMPQDYACDTDFYSWAMTFMEAQGWRPTFDHFLPLLRHKLTNAGITLTETNQIIAYFKQMSSEEAQIRRKIKIVEVAAFFTNLSDRYTKAWSPSPTRLTAPHPSPTHTRQALSIECARPTTKTWTKRKIALTAGCILAGLACITLAVAATLFSAGVATPPICLALTVAAKYLAAHMAISVPTSIISTAATMAGTVVGAFCFFNPKKSNQTHSLHPGSNF